MLDRFRSYANTVGNQQTAPAAAVIRHGRPIAALLVWQIGALAGQVVAVHLARQGHRGIAEILSDVSLALIFGSALWVLTRTHLSRSARNTAVVCLGLGPTLFWRATNPMLFTGFDEQLHMRTLGDIISSHRLFQPNPLLEVSPRYPGLETVTLVLHQIGLPVMGAATAVILLARLVLVTVLCDAVEQLTGSPRAGGLAVAVYAISPQFVFFNSQFSYQTLALPLALSAVSLLARARKAEDPVPLFGGATVCLFAVAMSHHVTSFLTAAFLLLWTAVERRPGRSRVAFGACAAIAATLFWAIVQRSLLTDYFGPIIDDVGSQFRGGARRAAFKDSAGTSTPVLDQLLLLYYAAVLCLVVASVALLTLRWWRKGERHLIRWGPHTLLLLLTGCIPVFLAARVVPKGGELFDRSSSFLFIPFSLVLSSYMIRLWWKNPPEHHSPQRRRVMAVRLVAIALAAGAFLGGYVLGSGPNWARLPGPFMAAADTRSMDAEVLAAVKWARGALPPGSRIAADRVSSDLLASQAGVWPVMKGPEGSGIDAPALYVARTWGMQETDMASTMRLRFLYVDRRMALELPHFGSYFFKGETGDGEQYTDAQLTKFDKVPGIKVVYRHGPVSIYDLKALGIPELRSGWYKPTPHVAMTTQLAVGLLAGLLIAMVMRSRIWPRFLDTAARLRGAWGPALTGAMLLASTCLVSAALLLSHVWLTPVAIWSGVSAVVLANLPEAASIIRRAAAWLSWRRAGIAALAVIPLSAIIAGSLLDAATEDIINVHRILNDPNAIHVKPTGPQY